MDRVRRQSRPVRVPNDQNRRQDRPIPSENIADDPGFVLFAGARLQHAPIIVRQACPHARPPRMLSPHDECHRRYLTNWLVRDSPPPGDRAMFPPISPPFHSQLRTRRITFASGSRPDGVHALTARRSCRSYRFRAARDAPKHLLHGSLGRSHELDSGSLVAACLLPLENRIRAKHQPHYRSIPARQRFQSQPATMKRYEAPSYSSLVTHHLSLLLPRAFGRLLQDHLLCRSSVDQAKSRPRTCRASSTTCMAASAGNLLASLPKSLDGRAA